MQGRDYLIIAVTGGVCSGKSSCMRRLKNRFSERFNVITVPESATQLVSEGFDPRASGDFELFQAAIIKRQLENESAAVQTARLSAKKSIIFTDRGLLDSYGYIGESADGLLAEHSLTREALKTHYDGVLHLATAAKGAQKFYSTANNRARTESLAEAAALDDRIIDAWRGSKNHIIIGNRGGFDVKLGDIYAAVEKIIEDCGFEP